MSTNVIQSEQEIQGEIQSPSLFSSAAQGWRRFTQGDKQVMVLALLATVVASVIVIMLWTASQGYRPLYGSQENVETSQVIEVLEAEGIYYRIESHTGLVLVADDQLGKARMLLAARGVKAKVPSGMDELDSSSLGTSQFMEQAKYRHGLEGELARSIMSLKNVRSARVHLAIPKRSLFIRQTPELPTASVMLQLSPGAELSQSQVEAVVNLVAGSVTGMETSGVKIVDQEGRFLSANINEDQDMTQARDRQITYTRELEQNLMHNASSMLEAILGPNNFQVKIAAKVNFNQIEETKEALDPQSVLVQERTSSDDKNAALAQGIPGALSNQPPQAAEGDKKDNTRNLRQEANRQFDVGRSVRHIRYQQMQLENISVSVLVNNTVATGLTTDDAELTKLGSMVKDAIGFSSERGDSFSINAFAFSVPTVAEFEPLPWWQVEDYQAYLRYLIGGLLGLGLILFVLRPLVSHLTFTAKHVDNETREPETINLAKSAESTTAESNTTTRAAISQGHSAEKSTAEWLGGLNLPEPGSPLTVQMEHLGMLANQEPARVAEVLAHWIGDKDAD
ncbi:flagellar M-ring protein FliF [Shewanella denitrificans OS217]|jgi:flagellar M-ring protein FliF|uniref:Flagellar M-ring protein n=1 Tax=Shewanella denitrificans (strain OS217 / ATCC BAA-1090 / DSM 15013) TaxID=318161 RepID=Q12HZ2_SHEDO|nr:flagellar basal-body MS-ring/collar protein FliF [Shewanella denitrificans]ABE56934.1 flagellar M-ring protein FliF [Shewanella denitrificans OS217]